MFEGYPSVLYGKIPNNRTIDHFWLLNAREVALPRFRI
jgi:hypothetical protein